MMRKKPTDEENENRIEWLEKLYISWKAKHEAEEIIEYEPFFEEAFDEPLSPFDETI